MKYVYLYLRHVKLFFRSHAVACVNQFIISRTQALMLHIDVFIEVSFIVRLILQQ